MLRRTALWVLVVTGLMLALAALAGLRAWQHEQAQLQQRLASIVPVGHQVRLDCRAVAAARPLVLLALGQSNAANHGELFPGHGGEVTLLAEGQCLRAQDPLPGGTGTGGSIWSRLEPALRERGVAQPLVLSVLAVDASTIADWTHSPLTERLHARLRMMRALGLPPTLLLWQQGEADARIGTTEAAYRVGLLALADTAAQAGATAPWLLAQSTVCRSAPSPDIRAAIVSAIASQPRFRPGPNTDLIAGPEYRIDGCHFNDRGLESAAAAWARMIVPVLP